MVLYHRVLDSNELAVLVTDRAGRAHLLLDHSRPWSTVEDDDLVTDRVHMMAVEFVSHAA